MSTSKFSEEMQSLISDISHRRLQIQEDFCRAYFASKLPFGEYSEADLNRIIQSVELVEQWSDDRLQVRWYFRERGA